ncbi:HNH endonuclease [Pseudomonas plecoglossicida]|uniref:HNH endonuclease n=1 Tax=Pseudomonas plecoglossicida TaxID=70775 RepID=A0A2R7UQG1_PSEDL|nr:HNH endonuclease [Pseudomonas plecoglossicida]PTU53384.1 HNH endonuclease [Pseudomonas plecoglossicida]
MAIKSVSKERIDEALREFDRDSRGRREWLDWENNQAHRYAIDVDGTHYPAKKIVSLATDIPVSEFSGGNATNSYLEKLGFTVVPLRGDIELALQFTPGVVYDRRTEINGPFGGSRQSGISASATHPAIFIFTGESGEQYGYADDWVDGAYLYTGEGQRGDMTLTRGNRALAKHAEDGRAVHLFESLGKGKGNRYKGEFTCANILKRTQADVDGNDRTALVFRLVPLDNPEPIVEVAAENEIELPAYLAVAREAALAACKPVTGDIGQSAPRNIYLRSQKVAHYVLMRAAGKCESCERPAPFKKKNGTHYLETHHVNRLSDGGLDHPRYVGAVCPNCHREIHFGAHGALINNRLKQRLEVLEH